MIKYWKIALLMLVVVAAAASALFASRTDVKEPAVAGAFYPADGHELSRAVDGYLANALSQPASGRLIALIAPHAGYVYSGQVAAHSYRHLGERTIDTVVLIGASHTSSYAGAAVYTEGGMRTPLGVVKVNEKIARSLLNEQAGVIFARGPFEKEHSLEVQLPFLQRTLKEVTVVPILMGAPTQASISHLADRLTEVMRKNERVIIVASTDLSHYHDSATAVSKDRKVIDAVARMSVEDLQGLLASNEGEACGGYPVLLTMLVGRNLGATNGVLYKYANSGDVSGDKSRVVGYAAMGLYKSALSEQQKKELLSLARKTVVDHVKNKRTPESHVKDSRLLANGATFVTINRNHQLRGCIGNIQPVMPLYRSVISNAVSASSRDPRFPPMTPGELADMEVEVTVLSPLERIDDAQQIRVGTHGVYLEKDGRSSVFLPQVPVEQGWDLKTYLEQLCFKAGLPGNAWKDKDARLFIFSADIIK
jgi:AmmeMemoRadiSam system protein B/AmmeMemoRadiSam system protein A